MRNRTLYEYLEVLPTASFREITLAYRNMVKIWHPDRYPDEEKCRAVAKMQMLNYARKTLLNPIERKKYDKSISIATVYEGSWRAPDFSEKKDIENSQYNNMSSQSRQEFKSQNTTSQKSKQFKPEIQQENKQEEDIWARPVSKRTKEVPKSRSHPGIRQYVAYDVSKKGRNPNDSN